MDLLYMERDDFERWEMLSEREREEIRERSMKMQETTRASEMTIEQIEDVLREMDWTEIHKARVWADYGASIVLYTDGTFGTQEQSTHYRDPDAASVIGYLASTPWGNCDSSAYFEGWVEKVRDSHHAEWNDDEAIYRVDGVEVDENALVEIETGRVLDETDAVDEAIEDGEWDYDEEIEAVVRQVEEYRREMQHRREAERWWKQEGEREPRAIDPRDAQ